MKVRFSSFRDWRTEETYDSDRGRVLHPVYRMNVLDTRGGLVGRITFRDDTQDTWFNLRARQWRWHFWDKRHIVARGAGNSKTKQGAIDGAKRFARAYFAQPRRLR